MRGAQHRAVRESTITSRNGCLLDVLDAACFEAEEGDVNVNAEYIFLRSGVARVTVGALALATVEPGVRSDRGVPGGERLE